MSDEPGIDVLDDPDRLVRADREGLLLAIARAGAQIRSTVERNAPLPADPPRAVLVVGPTAAPDAALLQALTGPGPAPWATLDPSGSDGPALPSWVGPLDIVVVLAGHRDDAVAAELVAAARHRGAAVVVRGAASGPVADAAGPSLVAPAIGTPESLALPSRLALLAQVAAAAGLAPATDLDVVAAALDAEALACGPAAESFTNPALALARGLWGSSPLVLGSDPVGRALAAVGAASLGVLGGLPAGAGSGMAALRAPQLIARLGRSRDPFADPYLDEDSGGPSAVPLLVAPGPGAPEPAIATHRALERALPRALLVADDGADAGRVASALTLRTAAALRVALRIDYAAVYLGMAAGQLAPADAPNGLGPAGSLPSARPATVKGMTGDDPDIAADPWDEATWN